MWRVCCGEAALTYAYPGKCVARRTSNGLIQCGSGEALATPRQGRRDRPPEAASPPATPNRPHYFRSHRGCQFGPAGWSASVSPQRALLTQICAARCVGFSLGRALASGKLDGERQQRTAGQAGRPVGSFAVAGGVAPRTRPGAADRG